jgi:hypothetical protein
MLTLDSAIPEVRDLETREQLFQHMIALADNILDGYNSQIASICNNEDMVEYTMQVEEQYRQERHNLIGPFCKYIIILPVSNYVSLSCFCYNTKIYRVCWETISVCGKHLQMIVISCWSNWGLNLTASNLGKICKPAIWAKSYEQLG